MLRTCCASIDVYVANCVTVPLKESRLWVKGFRELKLVCLTEVSVVKLWVNKAQQHFHPQPECLLVFKNTLFHNPPES